LRFVIFSFRHRREGIGGLKPTLPLLKEMIKEILGGGKFNLRLTIDDLRLKYSYCVVVRTRAKQLGEKTRRETPG
jgi:hypothetical protein